MKTTSKGGLLLESKIVCDGQFYRLMCSIEECPPFNYGIFKNIETALKGMTMFQLNRKTY